MISIKTIRKKMCLLRETDIEYKIKYSNKHKYESKPLSEAELTAFETRLKIQLPLEYRRYLLEVGYGFGPWSGICSLEQTWYEYSSRQYDLPIVRNISGTSPATIFPFNKGDAYRCFEDLAEKKFWEATLEGIYPENGTIPIVNNGSTMLTYLVTSGDLRGTVWDVVVSAVGYGQWYPAKTPPTTNKNFDKASKPLQTFFEWYENWLDKAICDVKNLYKS